MARSKGKVDWHKRRVDVEKELSKLKNIHHHNPQHNNSRSEIVHPSFRKQQHSHHQPIKRHLPINHHQRGYGRSILAIALCLAFVVLLSLWGEYQLTGLATFNYTSTSDFASGTYNQTFRNVTSNATQLNNSNFLSGTFTSEIFDGGAGAIWDNMTFVISAQGPAADNGAAETTFGSGNIDMKDCVFMYHLNNDSKVGETRTAIHNYCPNGWNGSGSGFDGTWFGHKQVNDTSVNPVMGLAAEMDGTHDYIQTEKTFDGSNLATGALSIWFYRIQDTGVIERVFGTDDEWEMIITDGVGASPDTISCQFYRASSVDSTNEETAPLNKWFHVVCNWDDAAANSTVYINGTRKASHTDTDGTDPTADNIFVGEAANNGVQRNQTFPGKIDEVILFNRTLTDAEVLALYERGIRRLNLSVRSCDDAACSGETFTDVGNVTDWTPLSVNSNRYFQFEWGFNTSNTAAPSLYNLSVGYTPYVPPPLVNTTLPVENSRYNITDVIEIGANVTDDTAVSIVLANVSHPNGTVKQYTLTNGTGYNDRFNVSFTVPDLAGEYDITYIANDSTNNINSSTTSRFTVYTGGEVGDLDMIAINESAYAILVNNVSGNRTDIFIRNTTGTQKGMIHILNGNNNLTRLSFTMLNSSDFFVGFLDTSVKDGTSADQAYTIVTIDGTVKVGYTVVDADLGNPSPSSGFDWSLSAFNSTRTMYCYNDILNTNFLYHVYNDSGRQVGSALNLDNLMPSFRPLYNHIDCAAVNETTGVAVHRDGSNNLRYDIVNSTSSSVSFGNLFSLSGNSRLAVTTLNASGSSNNNRFAVLYFDASNNDFTITQSTFDGASQSTQDIDDSVGTGGSGTSLDVARVNNGTQDHIVALWKNDSHTLWSAVYNASLTEVRAPFQVANVSANYSLVAVTESAITTNTSLCKGTYAVAYNDGITGTLTVKTFRINDTGTTEWSGNCPAVAGDTTNPDIVDYLPAINTVITSSTTLRIAANVTDEMSVSRVFANVSIPNGTTKVLEMIFDTGNRYNTTFTPSDLNGGYNITYVANDSTNNINSSVTTNFTVLGGCGTLTTNITMIQNISAPATCFTIGADHVNLDCAGYSVTYGQDASGYGVDNSGGWDNVTVKNCLLKKGSATGGSNYGIYFTNAVNGTIRDNTVNTNGTSSNHGIYLFTSVDNNVVANNTIFTQGTSSDNYGIYLSSTADNNNITGNTITTTGTSGDHGIMLDTSSNNTFISSNNISAGGTASSNYGVYITLSSNNTLLNNNISSSSFQDYDIFDDTNGSSPNYLIYNNSFGEIIWTNSTDNGKDLSFLENLTLNVSNGDGIGLGRNLFIGNNSAAFNTTAFLNTLLINSTANITLYSLNNWTSINGIKFLQNYSSDSSEIRSKGTNCTNCFIQSFSGGTLVFNVSSFSSYAGDSTPAASTCGTITSDTILINNVSSTTTCYTIGADNIILNCADYMVEYGTDGGNNSYGINNTGGFDNVTVKNCPLKKGSEFGENGYGILFNSAVNGTILNNTIITNGTTALYGNHGIFLNDSSNTTLVYNNTIFTDGSGGYNYGIYILRSSHENISSNTITTNGSIGSTGMYIETTVNQNVIAGNTIRTGGPSALNYGIYGTTSSSGSSNNITGNIIITSGTSADDGIFLTGVVNTFIYNNIINTTGSSGNNRGINLDQAAGGNISSNTINTNGTSDNYGILLDGPSSGQYVIADNTIFTRGTSTDNYGIWLNAVVNYSNITGNTIVTNGTTTNYGISLTTTINNTLVYNNKINTTGTSGGSNYGIYLNSRVGGNNISSNTINTNGSSSNHGVYLFTTVHQNAIADNTIYTYGTGSINNGIRLSTTCYNNNITGNIIVTNGTTTNYGIILTINSNDTLIYNNKINATGRTGGSNYGMYFTNRVGGNNLSSNTINTNGSTNNYGVHLLTNVNRNVIADNSISSQGTSTGNNGIFLSSTCNDNNITRNTITTTGTSSNQGISLQTRSNNTFISSNNISAGGTASSNYGVYITLSMNNTLLNNNISSSSFQDYDIFDDTNSSSPNFLIYNNSFGEILWTNGTDNGKDLSFLENLTLNISNADGIGLGRNLFIGNNTAAFNTTAFTSGLTTSPLINSTANITLYTLNNWSSLNAIKFLQNYSSDSSEIRSKGTNCTNCFIQSFSSGTLVFNVSSFSSYAGDSMSETSKPLVHTTLPAVNSIYNITNVIEIAANVTDETAVSRVFANVTYPNGTRDLLTLSNGSGFNDKFNISFRIPELIGTYNITYIGNDSFNNINSSTTSNFTVNIGCAYINIDTTMNQNVEASDTCFTINASDITLDCVGYTTTYGTGASGYAVNNSGGWDNITIKNCLLKKGSETGSDNYGIYFSNAANGTIRNNSIKTNGTDSNHGINLVSTNSTIVDNNTVISSGTSGTNIGIQLQSSTIDNVTSNTITTNGTIGNFGIYLTTTNSAIVHNNTISTGGTSSINYGIYLSSSPLNNLTRNTITTNGTSDNIGINMDTSNFTVIENNTITTLGTVGGGNFGVYLTESPFNNVTRNIISTNSTGNNNHGIYLVSKSNNTFINSNNITAGGTTSSNYGLRISSSMNNTLLNNNISSSSFQDYDLFDDTNSSTPNYLIYNNSLGEIIWTNGTDNGKDLSFLENLTLNVSNADGIGLGRNLFIGNNTATFNTTAFLNTLLINTSANITLYTLNNWTSLNGIKFLQNYSSDSSEIRSKGTNCTNCFIQSFSGGKLVFNVSSFSSYAGDLSSPVDYTLESCTDITASGIYSLENSISYNTTDSYCINISSSNVVFNGSNFLISGNGSLNTSAIYISPGYDNITIQNVLLSDFNDLIIVDGNLSIKGSTNIIVTNSSLSNGRTSGILVAGSNVNISTTIVRNATRAILAVGNASSLNIEQNIINTSDNRNDVAIVFNESSGNDTRIYNNTVQLVTNGIVANNVGTSVSINRFNLTILNNNVSDISGYAFSIQNVSNLTITGNIARNNSIGSAIYRSHNSTLLRNSFTGTQGFQLLNISESNGTSIFNNSFINAGTRTSSWWTMGRTLVNSSGRVCTGGDPVFIYSGTPFTTETVSANNFTLSSFSPGQDYYFACLDLSGPGGSDNTTAYVNASVATTCDDFTSILGPGNCYGMSLGTILNFQDIRSSYVYANNFNSTFTIFQGSQNPPFLDFNPENLVEDNAGIVMVDSCNAVWRNNSFQDAFVGTYNTKSSCTTAEFSLEDQYAKISWVDASSNGMLGKLEINENFSLGTGTINTGIATGNNSIAINRSYFTLNVTKVNSTANITLYTLNNWSSLNGIKYLENYTNSSSEIRSKGTNCTSCYINSFSGGTLTFNVSRFSSYAGDFVASNTLPTAPQLVSPANNSTITNRTSGFIWNNSADADSDTLTYRLVIDDSVDFSTPAVNVSSIAQGTTNTSYDITTELDVDTKYYWKVAANDSTGYGAWSNVSNFSLQSLLLISLRTSTVAFGAMNTGETNNTTTGNPPPFTAENAGNILANITLTGTAYFSSVALPSSSYQFKIRANESSSFTAANTSFLNMSSSYTGYHVINLSWQDVNDDFLADILVTVPAGEPAGAKSSTITFTIEG